MGTAASRSCEPSNRGYGKDFVKIQRSCCQEEHRDVIRANPGKQNFVPPGQKLGNVRQWRSGWELQL